MSDVLRDLKTSLIRRRDFLAGMGKLALAAAVASCTDGIVLNRIGCTPYGNPYSPYGNPYNPYGNPYGNDCPYPYGNPYGNPYGSRFQTSAPEHATGAPMGAASTARSDLGLVERLTDRAD